MKKEKITTWEDITLDQYMQIIQLLEVKNQDDLVFGEILKLVKGEEVEELPLAQYREQFKHIAFLQNPLPTVKVKTSYVLGGQKYICDLDVAKITGAQYLDYTNYLKENKGIENLSKLVSVFIRPKKAKYNDDSYDVDDLIDLIEKEMLIVDVNAIAFFLQSQYQTSIYIITAYSIKAMKTMMKKEKDPTKKAQIQDKMNQMILLSQNTAF